MRKRTQTRTLAELKITPRLRACISSSSGIDHMKVPERRFGNRSFDTFLHARSDAIFVNSSHGAVL